MDNGEMARGKDLIDFALRHRIPVISIAMLLETMAESDETSSR